MDVRWEGGRLNLCNMSREGAFSISLVQGYGSFLGQPNLWLNGSI